MTFPAVQTKNGGFDSTGTAHTVNLPASIAAGDLLIVLFENAGNGTASVTTPASGWTSLLTALNGTTDRVSVFYRVADGSEGSTITVTTSASVGTSHESYRVSGTDTATAPEGGSAVFTTSANPDPPALTPSWGAQDTLFIAGAVWASSATVISYPTSYTDNQATHGGAGSRAAISSRNLNATSDNPGTFTLTTTATGLAVTLAVKPTPPPTLMAQICL